jgi:hypothetical protein
MGNRFLRKGHSSPLPWGRISMMRTLLTALTCLMLFA